MQYNPTELPSYKAATYIAYKPKSRTLTYGTNIRAKIPNSTTYVKFTDEKAPDGAILFNLSDDGRNGVVGWIEGTAFNVSTQTKGVKIIANSDCSDMFKEKTLIKEINLENLDTKDTKNMYCMFCDCSALTTININRLDTKNVDNMYRLFYGCSSLLELDMSNLNTCSVEDMSSMFENCIALKKLDISNFDTNIITGKNNGKSYMFNGCRNLQEVKLGDNFSWISRESNYDWLPAPNSLYIDGADGKWYDVDTNIGYTPGKIPNNKAATYVAVKPKSRTLLNGSTLNSKISSSATSVIFTDEQAPSGANLTNLADDGKDGIVGWMDGTTYKVSTQKVGQKIIANENCSAMFAEKKVT